LKRRESVTAMPTWSLVRCDGASALATSSRLHYPAPPKGLRPEIRQLIEALARDAVAREDRCAQECAGKDQTEEQ
jgi:hypothetical protein